MFNGKSILFDKRDDFFQSPNVVGDSRFHRGRDAQGLVNPAEIVVHEVNRGMVFVVVQLLAKGVGQPREAAVAHAECEVLAFNVAGGHKQAVGIAGYTGFARADAGWRRVADCRAGSFPYILIS
jgi:hypothetical protein